MSRAGALSEPGLVELVELVERDGQALLDCAELSESELSIVLCSDDHIRELNARWRGHDAPTDVLSFPMDDERVLGDVVVSLHTCRRQAAERQHEVLDELRVLLVHGLLHLLGYDHETGAEGLAEMAAAERRLLGRLQWKGAGLISAVR
ncbi:MAG TPA: rRNA maturation RNase YbeY [Myxococcota bacterium]|nr:rRNA maturation RNase YbeY [Myxococcota bacterium]